MRVHRNPMRNVIWTDWIEPIDQGAYAAIAMAEETWRGGVYSASTILLVEAGTPRYRAREQVHQKLADEMERRVHLPRHPLGGFTQGRFGMPLRGWVRDLRR